MNNFFDGRDYHFRVAIAKEVGVDGAIMLNHLQYWILHNQAHKMNFHDGEYWTYSTKKALCQIFPFWSERQIERILNNLIKNGYLKTGNYNKVAFDRTLWYTLTEKGWKLFALPTVSIPPNGLMESPECVIKNPPNGGMRNHETVEPIPNNNTNKKTNNNISAQQLEQIEKLWALYPNKKGKSRAIKDIKKHMKNYTYEQLENAVKAYAAEVAGRDKQYIKHGSTFFKDGILDYLEAEGSEEPKASDGATKDEEYFMKLMEEQLKGSRKLG